MSERLHYSVNGQECHTEARILTARDILESAGYDPSEYYLIEFWEIRGRPNLERLHRNAKVWLKDDSVFYARLLESDCEDEKPSSSSVGARGFA